MVKSRGSNVTKHLHIKVIFGPPTLFTFSLTRAAAAPCRLSSVNLLKWNFNFNCELKRIFTNASNYGNVYHFNILTSAKKQIAWLLEEKGLHLIMNPQNKLDSLQTMSTSNYRYQLPTMSSLKRVRCVVVGTSCKLFRHYFTANKFSYTKLLARPTQARHKIVTELLHLFLHALKPVKLPDFYRSSVSRRVVGRYSEISSISM